MKKISITLGTFTAVFLTILPVSKAQQVGFNYHGPGDMAPLSERGVRDRRVHVPTINFPLHVGPDVAEDGDAAHAYANSQIFKIPGNPKGYTYPWRDNYCESRRGWSMPACPSRKGHQGQDIRPSTKKNKFWEAIAVEDGIVDMVTSNTTVRIRFDSNPSTSCRYLHLKPIYVKKGDRVKKGKTVVGRVSNIMGGRPNTSIHLHFDCKTTHPDLKRKVHIPIYTSLITSYRRAWGLPDMTTRDVLLTDPEREIKRGSISCPPRAGALVKTKDMVIHSRWLHNCSEMGLVVEGNDLKFVYIRPKLVLAASASRNPVLVRGTLQSNQFQGSAVHFNKACNDPQFDVKGSFLVDDKHAQFVGTRETLNRKCKPSRKTLENLVFTRVQGQVDIDKPQPPIEPGATDKLTCPFDVKPGESVQMVGGRELPPKSERSCNFLAVTVPGGVKFSQMPRYIREWPGVRKDVLIDKYSDQIITLRTSESGVGMWWYWIVHRARNGVGLKKKGFGSNGKPNLAQLARAMAGRKASAAYVKRNYLRPYLLFASRYFKRTITAKETIDLSLENNRWNLARTMFRLESGNEPVVSRPQFRCGLQFGSDIERDFTKAGIESGPSSKVVYSAFKGLEHYTNNCPGEIMPPQTGGTPGSQGSDAETSVIALKRQLFEVKKIATGLKQDKHKLKQQLLAAKRTAQQVGGNLSQLAEQLNKLSKTEE